MFIAFDSGIQRTGWAVFEDGCDKKLVAHGCITTSKTDLIEKRLSQLYGAVKKLINTYRPSLFVIEQLFFNTNQKTVITVAQAQGVVLSLAGETGIMVKFLTPLHIKQALTGYGRSDKIAVQKMVLLELGLKKAPKPDDVVDAIAVGLAWGYRSKYC